MSAEKRDARAKAHLRAVIHEYLIPDDRLDEDKLLELLIDAVTRPTSEQPLVIQQQIEGTRAYRLYRTKSSALDEDDQRFLAEVDDFRTRNL